MRNVILSKGGREEGGGGSTNKWYILSRASVTEMMSINGRGKSPERMSQKITGDGT